ncbi:MAG: N-formylglutamate amidohydrolase, partial [bacterium]|nr:N-formylglutamate amidohydrolase [bacterium]
MNRISEYFIKRIIIIIVLALTIINPRFDDVLIAKPQSGNNYVSGTTYYGENNYVEYYAGELPIVLSAPHGGDLVPSEIPDRTYGTTVTDSYTIETALAIRTAIYDLTGRYPHLIVSKLKRTKLDPNRSIGEAAQGNQYAEQAYNEYHNFIEIAKDTVEAHYDRGLYLDLHGHGHSILRLELGYLLTSSDLENSDSGLNQSYYINKSSVRELVNSRGLDFADLIRGDNSFGAYLAQYGVPSVPSPENPDPGGYTFFSGGYSTVEHGSRDGGTINGIQIEMHRVGLRDTQNNRENFAEDLAQVIDSYMNENFGIDIVTNVEPEERAIPNQFILTQNYPNPFNLETSIRVEMPYSSAVSLNIYNLSGQLIKTILSQKLLQA